MTDEYIHSAIISLTNTMKESLENQQQVMLNQEEQIDNQKTIIDQNQKIITLLERIDKGLG